MTNINIIKSLYILYIKYHYRWGPAQDSTHKYLQKSLCLENYNYQQLEKIIIDASISLSISDATKNTGNTDFYDTSKRIKNFIRTYS